MTGAVMESTEAPGDGVRLAPDPATVTGSSPVSPPCALTEKLRR